MKHVKLFEQFLGESTRIPTTLYPSEFREYFSRRYEDFKTSL